MIQMKNYALKWKFFLKKAHFKNMSKNQNFMDYLFYYVVYAK